MTQSHHTYWALVKGYFNALPDKESEQDTIDQISSDAVFRGSKLWVLIFAIFIASLGLNTNSTAVIIGAMLISPLMGPIIGMGLGIGISDFELLKRSFKNYAVATIISVLTATIYFLITPITEAQSELLARTSPTLYDVLIALIGGAAGFLALATKGKGNVIPGVAIATALMPPLCTAGYGLAVGQLTYFLGAFYLFFINTVFICLATFLGTRLLRFRQKEFVEADRMRKVKQYIVAIVVVTMLPATYMTMQIIRRSVREGNVLKFIKTEMTFKGTQVISHQVHDHTISVVAVGRNISKESISRLKASLPAYQLSGYKLNVIQGAQSDSTLLSKMLAGGATTAEATNKQLMEQAAQMARLEQELGRYTRYDDLTRGIRTEMTTLWPAVSRMSLAPVTEAQADTTAVRRYVVAIVGYRGRMAHDEQERMQRWIRERVKADSVRLILTE